MCIRDSTRTRFQLITGDVGSTQSALFSFNNTSATSLLDVMTLNESGNVGIGTTSPSEKLHIATGTNTGSGIRVDTGLDNGSASSPSALVLRNIGGTTSDAVAATFNVGLVNRARIIGGRYSNGGYLQLQTGNSSNTLLNRVRIDNSGNVGIGNTNPQSELHISNGASRIRLTNENNQTWQIGTENAANGFLAIKDITDSRDVLVLNGDGNVGIGTTSPSYKLDIQSGTGSSDRVQLRLKNNGTGDGDAIIYLDSSAGGESDIDFMHDGALNWRFRTGDASQTTNTNFNIHNAGDSEVFTIEQGGNIGIGTTSPNARLEIEDNGTTETQIVKITTDDANPYGLACLLYTSPSPRDRTRSRMPSSA